MSPPWALIVVVSLLGSAAGRVCWEPDTVPQLSVCRDSVRYPIWGGQFSNMKQQTKALDDDVQSYFATRWAPHLPGLLGPGARDGGKCAQSVLGEICRTGFLLCKQAPSNQYVCRHVTDVRIRVGSDGQHIRA